MKSIRTAMDEVDTESSNIRLGIRMFGDYDEIKAWYPEYNGSRETPYWLRYKNGKVTKNSHSGKLLSKSRKSKS